MESAWLASIRRCRASGGGAAESVCSTVGASLAVRLLCSKPVSKAVVMQNKPQIAMTGLAPDVFGVFKGWVFNVCLSFPNFSFANFSFANFSFANFSLRG